MSICEPSAVSLRRGFREDTPDQITLVSESLPYGGDQDGTQLLCSPSQLLTTDVAQKTLKDLDEHDQAMEGEVQSSQARVTKHVAYNGILVK